MTDVNLKGEGLEEVTAAKGKHPAWSMEPPPEGDFGVAAWVWQRFEYMKQYRESLGLPALWIRFHEIYRNRLFKRRSPYTLLPVNLGFKTINTLVSNLTDNKPRATIMAQGDTSDEAGNAWQAAYDDWWDRTKQQSCLQDSVFNSELNGFQVDKIIWNSDLEGGSGEVETVVCDPFGIFLWPRIMDIQKGPIAHAEAMLLGEIYRRWPNVIDQVTADPAYSDLLGETRAEVRGSSGRRDMRPIGGSSDFYQSGEVDAPRNRYGEIVGGRALVVEFWVHDFTMQWVDPRTGEEVKKNQELLEPLLHPDTGEPLFDASGQQYMTVAVDPETGEPLKPQQEGKYPGFIRCITVVNSGTKQVPMVLEDKPNPSINPLLPREITANCYLFDKFPFVKRLSYSDNISEYGLAILEQVEPLIMEISKKISQIAMHLHNQAIAPLILPKECGVRRDQVSNLPKRIWEPVAALAEKIRFLQVPAMSTDFMGYINLLMRLMEIITGITDVSEGRRPTGITAGVAISELQEKAQVIFRQKIRNLDISLEEQSRMYQSLAQNWLVDIRKLRVGEGPQQRTITFQGMAEEYQGELAFHIEAGSTLPRNRAMQRQETIQLADKGMIDDVAVLDELKFPKRDEIIRRKQEGIIGAAMGKLQQSGLFDEATLQSAQKVLALDDQAFKKAFPETGNPYEMAG